MIFPIFTKLAGVSFYDRQASIMKWGCDDICFFALEREPINPHDPNAIGVWFFNDQLGYLPVSISKDLAPLMDAGLKLTAEFFCLNQSNRPGSWVPR